MSVLIQPIQSGQFSAQSTVEVAQAAGRATLGQHLSLPRNGLTSEVAFSTDLLDHVPHASSEPNSEVAAPLSRWSGALERRFAHLAARIATKTATNDEQRE